MLTTYQFKIKPNAEQIVQIENWLELLRRHYNYALGQRLDLLNKTRCQIDRCSIISCPIGEIPEKVDYHTQQSALKETKVLFPDYKEIYSEVQQINLQRLDKAWWRWLVPDKTGKRAGRPKFKKKGEMRSFGFSRVNHPKAACFLESSILRIPRFGEIPVVVHRPLPDGFTLKTADAKSVTCGSVVKKADGWYVSISLEDDSVPSARPIDKVKTAIGVDVGLKEFLTASNGSTVPVQKIYRLDQARLARQQRNMARSKEGSKNAKKQTEKVAKIHQRVARQREDFHYKTAYNLVKKYDLIAV